MQSETETAVSFPRQKSALMRFLLSIVALVALPDALCGQSWWQPDMWRVEASSDLKVTKDVTYRVVGSDKLKADIVRPDDNKSYPLVLMVHGGGWTTGDKWELLNHVREVAKAGFVAVSINYRLAPKHRMESQIDDCRFALGWAINNCKSWGASADRVGLWGYSAGGHLVSMIALDDAWKQPRFHLKDSPNICAVVAGGAPCSFDFIPSDNRVVAHVFGGTKQEVPEAYRRASPVEYARADAPSFFFFHGTSDFLVPQSVSKQLFDKLQGLGVDSEYLSVDGKGHMFTFLDSNARNQAVQFLVQRLVKD